MNKLIHSKRLRRARLWLAAFLAPLLTDRQIHALGGFPAMAGGMGNPNVRPSDRAPVADRIAPVSQAPGTAVGAWVSMQTADEVLMHLHCGVLGAAATVDAKLQQATDNAGTGAKDVVGKAIVQVVKATGDNTSQLINCRSDELDVNNGFCFVRMSVTVGVAASLIAAELQAFDSRYQPQAQAAAVTQVI